MKFWRKCWFPFASFVEIKDKKVSFYSFPYTRFSMDINSVTASFQPKGIGGLTGYGNVTISDSTQSQTVTKLFSGNHLRDSIQQQKEKIANEQKRKNSGQLPEGIKFSDKVILLPPPVPIFDRALWIQHTNPSLHPIEHSEYGKWINRGDNLFSFYIHTSFFNATDVTIPSPVSGLVLYAKTGFSKTSNPDDDYRPYLNRISILLPENEPPPESVNFMYREFCDFCFEHRAYIFQKPEEFRYHETYQNDGKLKKLFEMQKSATYRYASSQKNLQYIFKELMEELMKDPQIRKSLST